MLCFPLHFVLAIFRFCVILWAVVFPCGLWFVAATRLFSWTIPKWKIFCGYSPLTESWMEEKKYSTNYCQSHFLVVIYCNVYFETLAILWDGLAKAMTLLLCRRRRMTPMLPGQRAILVSGDDAGSFLEASQSHSDVLLFLLIFCCPSSSIKSSQLLSAHLIWTRLDTADMDWCKCVRAFHLLFSKYKRVDTELRCSQWGNPEWPLALKGLLSLVAYGRHCCEHWITRTTWLIKCPSPCRSQRTALSAPITRNRVYSELFSKKVPQRF